MACSAKRLAHLGNFYIPTPSILISFKDELEATVGSDQITRNSKMIARLTYKSAVKLLLWDAKNNFAASTEVIAKLNMLLEDKGVYQYVKALQRQNNDDYTMLQAIAHMFLESAREGPEAGVTEARLHLYAVGIIAALRADGKYVGTSPAAALAYSYELVGLDPESLMNPSELEADASVASADSVGDGEELVTQQAQDETSLQSRIEAATSQEDWAAVNELLKEKFSGAMA